MKAARWISLPLLVVMVAACERESFNWDQLENFMLQRTIEKQPDGSVKMTFVGLVNVSPDKLFDAMSDVEHHAEFIEDVTEVKLVSVEGKKKVVDIKNRVLGRPNEARIEWTIDKAARRLSFRTVEAKYTDNSADYRIEGSPDGTRSRVTTIYYLREKGGQPFPLYTLQTGIEESYLKAVAGVKRRALGKRAVVGP